jgi:hypothetical protein
VGGKGRDWINREAGCYPMGTDTTLRKGDEKHRRDRVVRKRVDENVLATLWLGEEVTKKVFSEHECRKGSSGVDKG